MRLILIRVVQFLIVVQLFVYLWTATGPAATISVGAGLSLVVAVWFVALRGHMACQRDRVEARKALENEDWRTAGKYYLSACEKARALPRRREGPLAVALLDLASFYSSAHQAQAAEGYAKEAVAVLDAPGNPMTRRMLPEALDCLLKCLEAQCKFTEADEVLDRILDLTRVSYGPRSR